VVFNAIEQLKAIDGDLETMSEASWLPEVAAECERTRRMVREVIEVIEAFGGNSGGEDGG
jgi:hypothetical protein